MPPSFKKVDLYGGALTVELPSDFGDVSNIRDIPDQQEVYLSATGLTSIIFDILERAEPPAHPCSTDEEALEYHYADTIETGHGREGHGEAEESTTVLGDGRAQVVSLPNVPVYTTIRIQASASPLPSTEDGHTDFTGVLMTLVRLEAQKSDFLVTINVPHVHGEYDKEGVDIHRGKVGALMEAAEAYQERIWNTLRVEDWDLFAEE